tara:strand:- start:1241 stop:1489 length:249 start_codon:yes stop_codon:yes gene_type:complete
MEDQKSIVKRWEKDVRKLLLNRTIVKVRYLTDEEVEDLGWYAKAIVLHLDDGTLIYPSRDDEGNDAGALFTTNEDLPTIPVI